MVEVVKEGKQGIPLSVVYAVCVMPVESVCAVLEPETRSILALASPCCPRPEPHVASATLDFRVFTDGGWPFLILILISIVMFRRHVHHDAHGLMVRLTSMVTCMK
jgi:hypothetical protein